MRSRARCLPPATWKRCSRSPARRRWTCGPVAVSSPIFVPGTRCFTAKRLCCTGFRNKNPKRRGVRMAAPDVTMLQAQESEETTNTNAREDADSTSDISAGQALDSALADLIDYLAVCCDDSTQGWLHV